MECAQAVAGGTVSREGPPELASPTLQCNLGEMCQTETKGRGQTAVLRTVSARNMLAYRLGGG